MYLLLDFKSAKTKFCGVLFSVRNQFVQSDLWKNRKALDSGFGGTLNLQHQRFWRYMALDSGVFSAPDMGEREAPPMFYLWFSHSCPVFFANKNTVNNQRSDTASRNVSTIKLKINITFWFSYLVTRQLARSQSRTASIIFQPTDQMFERFINFVRFRTVALYRCQLKIKIMGNADWWLSAELIIWLLYLSKLGVPGT